MPAIIDYILKLSICVTVVYIFYLLLLRKLTFYNWNRWYLLGYTFLSFIIPIIDVMPSLQQKQFTQSEVLQWVPVVGFAPPAEKSFLETMSFWDWGLVLIGLGIACLLIRFVIKLASFKKIKGKATLISMDNPKIYQLNQPVLPFSFGNAIYINTNMHEDEELDKIIRHEFVHIKQKHTVDMLWAEFLCIVNWYNPVVWLLRHSIRQNLEFIADDKVVQNGYDKTQYQYLLLKVMGNRQFAFATNFNFSSLKKRIAMMNTVKSAKVHLIKFLFLLPVIAVLLLSFRKEVLKQQPPENTNETITTENLMVNTNIESSTTTENVSKLRNFSNNLKDTVPKVKEETKLIFFKSSNTSSHPPLIFIDGNEMEDGYNLNNIIPEDIASITALKDSIAISQYGEKGKHGVLKIITKSGKGKNKNVTFSEKIDNAITSKGAVDTTTKFFYITIYDEKKLDPHSIKESDLSMNKKPNEVVKGYKTSETNFASSLPSNVYYVLNGEAATKDDIDALKPNVIKSVDVLKHDVAVKYYGEKAKHGAVIITTK